MRLIQMIINDPVVIIPIIITAFWIFAILKFIFFSIPHKHKYKTTTIYAKYARCWCGSGICLKEAEKGGIKIYEA